MIDNSIIDTAKVILNMYAGKAFLHILHKNALFLM